MTSRERTLFVISLVASMLFWGWLYGWKFSLVFIPSLLIHEYGHYRQMGREGIGKRNMLFIPPLGVMAQMGDPPATLGSEARIALAGPIAGLIPTLFFALLFGISHSNFWVASAILSAGINLFNLVCPVPILDGGRIVKSLAFSVGQKFGHLFYLLGFVCILLLFFITPPYFPIFLLWFTYNEYMGWRSASKYLAFLREKLSDQEQKESYKKELNLLQRLAYEFCLTSQEIRQSLVLFPAIIAGYFLIIWLGYQSTGLNLLSKDFLASFK